jgi:hypothetical protein
MAEEEFLNNLLQMELKNYANLSVLQEFEEIHLSLK